MSATIVNPDIPYNGEVPGKLQPGWMCRLQGVTHPEADRFNINLQVGPNSKPRDDTALHLSVRLNQGYIARNSYQGGSWGDEQGSGSLPIGVAQSWEIIILVDENDYKIAVNGQHFCEFPFRIPISKVSHLLIDGDVSITLISWEGIAGVATESSTQSSQLHSQTPQGFQGAPPQANYNPQAGYGAPGYGPPPPPGVEPHSGFESFFEQAQTVLAGAIKSGAAEKLLGGLLSSGGQQQQPQGYAHQNAKYGIYPDLPQDLDPNYQDPRSKQSQQPGPVESLLMNFLSGGNKQQNQPPPGAQQSQPPQPPQQGIDLNSLLGNLLSGNQKPATLQQYQTQQNNTPGNQDQSLDLSSLLSGLLSSTAGTQQLPPGHVPQMHIQESNRQQHGQGAQYPNSNQGIDLTQIMGALSGLMAHTRPIQETGSTGGVHTPQSVQAPQGEQGKGVDLSGILSGILSGGNQQNPEQLSGMQAPPGQIPPRQGAGVDLNSILSGLLSGGGSQPQNLPQGPGPHPTNNPQSQGGIDFNSLLSNLLAGDRSHEGPHSGQPHSELPRGPTGPQSPQPAKFGPGNHQFAPNAPQAPPEHLPRQNPGGNPGKGSQPAPNTEIEDVSDQLAEVIAAEGGAGGRSQASQQYGQYPHPPQQERGPVEGLLSNFLGGAQQTHQPQSNFGGGESIGGLGSMSGILSGLAGSLLQPRDNQNQRQNH